MLNILLEISGFLLNSAERLERAQDNRRERVVRYLNKVTDTFTQIASELEAGRDPSFACATIDEYAKQEPDTLEAVLGRENVSKFRNQLLAVAQSREIGRTAYLKNSANVEERMEGEQAVKTIKEIAGRLKAIAERVEASEAKIH